MKPRKRCRCRDADGRDLGATCPKLRRRDGSWNPNHGRWMGKAELPPGPDGKRLDLKAGGFGSEDELKEWFGTAELLLSIPEKGPRGHEARVEILRLIKESRAQKADLPDYDDIRLRHKQGVALQTGLTGDYLDAWLEGKKGIRRNTWRGYESHIRVHLRPHLGHIELDRLRPTDISAMFTKVEERNEKIRRGEANGRITGPGTQKLILATLSNALGDGYPHITWNPAKHVELAPVKRQKALLWTPAREKTWRAAYEQRIAEERSARPGRNVDTFKLWRLPTLRPSKVMVWTGAQTGEFLDRAEDHRLYPLFHLVAHTGLRRGEACGAEVDSLDLDGGELLISAALVQLGWEVEDGDPKTEASDAPVALGKETVKALRAHVKRRNEERLEWGDAWVESGKLFTRENGEPYHPAWVTDQFERLAFEAGLPPITLHGLRHGAATLALAAGLDIKVVSAMLRHSSISITADLYTEVVGDLAREAAEKTAALIPRKKARGTRRVPNGSPRLESVQRKASA
jgi:integrase